MDRKSACFLPAFCLAMLPGGASARTFTDDGGRTVEAELAGMNGGNVVLSVSGRRFQWPYAKLSGADQAYVRQWLESPPETERIEVRIWEREGIGESGVLERPDWAGPASADIPLLRETETRERFRHYDVDLKNPGPGIAAALHLSYVLYVIDASGTVVDFAGSASVERIEPGQRITLPTRAATLRSTKTTSATFSVGIFGNLSVGKDTDRGKERFGGAWVRVYDGEGKLLGERRELHDELERLDFGFTGTTGTESAMGPLLETLEGLAEQLQRLPLPPRPGFLPKGKGFPPPPP